MPSSAEQGCTAHEAASGRRSSTSHGDRGRRAGLFAAVAASALVPVYKPDQLVYALAFSVAAASTWLWGGVFARVVLRAPRVGPCTRVYLGQFVLLAAAVPVTALNHAAAAVLGGGVPLPLLVVGATAVLAALEARAGRFRGASQPPRIDLLTLVAVGSVSVVLAICSRHLSALGLDDHQHVAWTRQIVEGGFIPLAEPPTRFIDAYPRSFHLLTGLWNAAAFGIPAGPFVKLMPFLQSALPALAVAEGVVADQTARAGEWAARRWQAALGIAFLVYAFLAVPMAYPWPDLSGTPRFSSGGLLILPVLLVFIARLHQAPAAAGASLAVLPVVGAWALTFNPVISVQVVTATCPLLVAAWVALRPPWGAGASRAVAIGGAASCVLAAVVAVSDPWVVTQLAERTDRAAALLKGAGLATLKQAESTGEVTPREKSARSRPPPPACDGACVGTAVSNSLRHAISWPQRVRRAVVDDVSRILAAPSGESTRRLFEAVVPLGGALADHAPLPLAAVVASAAALAASRRMRRSPASLAERLLWAAIISLPLVAMLGEFAARVPAELQLSSNEGLILIGYLAVAHRYLAQAFLWLPVAAAVAVLSEPLLSRGARPPTRPYTRARTTLAVVALAAWIALPLMFRPALLPIRGHPGWGGRISLSDIRALRRVEAAIPPADAVLVPAVHWTIPEWEHWVLPRGETATLLPYGERKYLFNVYLGAAFPFSWRDLAERVCSADQATRQEFLRRAGARWFLVFDRGARDAADAARRTAFCGVTLEEFGVELPPVRSDGGIYLFRLREARAGLNERSPAR